MWPIYFNVPVASSLTTSRTRYVLMASFITFTIWLRVWGSLVEGWMGMRARRWGDEGHW